MAHGNGRACRLQHFDRFLGCGSPALLERFVNNLLICFRARLNFAPFFLRPAASGVRDLVGLASDSEGAKVIAAARAQRLFPNPVKNLFAAFEVRICGLKPFPV